MKILDRIVNSIIAPPAFGLDISDFTVKFFNFSITPCGELLVDAFGEGELPEGVVVEGEIKKEKDLISFLASRLVTKTGNKIRRRFVAATLPEEKSFVRLIQLPKIKPEEASKAVRWELEGFVPLPVGELYFDYSFLPQAGSPDHMDLFVTAFPKTIIDSYVRVIEGAGFVPVALELESQAIARALWNNEPGTFIFVDLGALRTSLSIMAGGALIFTLSLPIAGRDFDRAISERLGVPIDEARKLKIDKGLSKDFKGGAVYEALFPYVTSLENELRKLIAFYSEHTEHRHGLPSDVSAIVLAGGDANLIGLDQYLSLALKKEVRLGNPLGRLLKQKTFAPPFSKNHSLKYTASIGAALRGINP